MKATMDGRGLIGETFGDGAAIAAVVMNAVTGAGDPRAAKTAALMSRHFLRRFCREREKFLRFGILD